MARYHEPTPAQEARWREWVASRPDEVRAVAERFTPWDLYRLKTTGQLVVVRGFAEPNAPNEAVTLTVIAPQEFNVVPADIMVLGIDPADMEPCELSSRDEVAEPPMRRAMH